MYVGGGGVGGAVGEPVPPPPQAARNSTSGSSGTAWRKLDTAREISTGGMRRAALAVAVPFVYVYGYGYTFMPREETPLWRANRRTAARHICQLQAEYRADCEWRGATVMDFSPNGCRLRVGEVLLRATPVSVRLKQTGVGARALSVEVDGTVIWSRVEGLSHQAGIQFLAAAPELAAILAELAQPQAAE